MIYPRGMTAERCVAQELPFVPSTVVTLAEVALCCHGFWNTVPVAKLALPQPL